MISLVAPMQIRTLSNFGDFLYPIPNEFSCVASVIVSITFRKYVIWGGVISQISIFSFEQRLIVFDTVRKSTLYA